MFRHLDIFISIFAIWNAISEFYINGLTLELALSLLFAWAFFRCGYRAFKYPSLHNWL